MQDSLTNDHLSVATAAFVEYATAVDEARVDDFVNLFTPDAVFYRPDVVGHAAIAQLTREMLAHTHRDQSPYLQRTHPWGRR